MQEQQIAPLILETARTLTKLACVKQKYGCLTGLIAFKVINYFLHLSSLDAV